jgi:hypothetical protein
MNRDIKSKKTIHQNRYLVEQRKEILSSSPDKALQRILNADHPGALVRSFPEEDFYFLIHHIGPEDSLPLLSLASYSQWEYIFDLEMWEKDRVELKSVTKWLHLLLKANSTRLMKWVLDENTEFIEFYLFKNIEVKIRDHDQDPSDFGRDFFTFDNTYYIRIIDDPFNSESDAAANEHKREFLVEFLNNLSSYNHLKYQSILLETNSLLPAETEEEAYRLRNVRLAEKGFLPFDEAIGIYQPLTATDLKSQGIKFIAPRYSEQNLFLPAPIYPSVWFIEGDIFTSALALIETDDVLQQIQTEFAGLCNLLIAADQKKIREREQLKSIVKKACGYISIGLESLSEGDGEMDIHRTAAFIQRYPLSGIFKVGYGRALQLKWRTERWQEKCWFAKKGLPLSFWGEEWLGVLGGLLLKKPLFFDNYETGVLYRDFSSIEDIQKTDCVLSEIIAFDDLLSLMSINLEGLRRHFLTYKSLVLTLWARHYLDLSHEPSPLTLEEFRLFFDCLWSKDERPQRISIWMKENFLTWLSGETRLDAYDISQRLAKSLENLFAEIESEYGQVLKKDLDSRFIYLFLIEKPANNKDA